jgi:hypothetical protein
MNVGVMKNYKLRDLRASHTLSGLVVELEHLKIKTLTKANQLRPRNFVFRYFFFPRL